MPSQAAASLNCDVTSALAHTLETAPFLSVQFHYTKDSYNNHFLFSFDSDTGEV
jgi:hypothetical protein